MTPRFTIKYEETKENIFRTCELYRLDSSINGFRIGALALSIMILVAMIANMGVFQSSPVEVVIFLLKYCGIWALIFVGLECFRKTFGKKLASTAAYGDANGAYERRKEKNINDLRVEIDFFDDHLVNITPTSQKEYSYKQVVKLLESDKAIGLVIRSEQGAKGLFAFPKEALEDTSPDAFKSFIENCCPHVKKGFRKL